MNCFPMIFGVLACALLCTVSATQCVCNNEVTVEQLNPATEAYELVGTLSDVAVERARGDSFRDSYLPLKYEGEFDCKSLVSFRFFSTELNREAAVGQAKCEDIRYKLQVSVVQPVCKYLHTCAARLPCFRVPVGQHYITNIEPLLVGGGDAPKTVEINDLRISAKVHNCEDLTPEEKKARSQKGKRNVFQRMMDTSEDSELYKWMHLDYYEDEAKPKSE